MKMKFFDKYDEYKMLEFFEKIDGKTIKLKDSKSLLEYASAPWVYKKGKSPDYIDYAFSTFLKRKAEIKVPKNVKGLIIDGISEEILKGGSFKRWRVCFKISRARLFLKKKGSRIKPSHIALEYDNLGAGMLKFYLKEKKLAKLWSFLKHRLAGKDKNKDIFNEEIKEKEKEIVLLLEKATVVGGFEGDDRKVAVFNLEKEYRRTFFNLLKIKDDKKEINEISRKVRKSINQLMNYQRVAKVLTNLNSY